MQTTKTKSIVVAALMILFLCQKSNAQWADFYSSAGYSNFINNMMTNSIWQSSMDRYTKNYKGGSVISKSDTASQRPEEIPLYRRYPAVQFKSTGTRLTLQTYLDAVEISAAEKAELKELVLKILKDYEVAAAKKGYPNDWALAYVSYIGLNSHVYSGKTEKPIIPFEQNLGMRDVVAEYATDNDIFKNVTDKQKQELYELLVMLSGLTYHFYEKACKENNVQEIENCKRSAEQHLKLIGIKPQ
jgi:hypothetical protein